MHKDWRLNALLNISTMKLTKFFILIFIIALPLLMFQGVFESLAGPESSSSSAGECSGGGLLEVFVCGISATDPEGNKVTLTVDEDSLPNGLKVLRGDELTKYDQLPNLECAPSLVCSD